MSQVCVCVCGCVSSIPSAHPYSAKLPHAHTLLLALLVGTPERAYFKCEPHPSYDQLWARFDRQAEGALSWTIIPIGFFFGVRAAASVVNGKAVTGG